MNKRNQLNLALLVLIIIAASAAFLDSTDNSSSPPPITSLNQDEIKNITIKRADKKDIFLKKQHAQWLLIKPYNTATNQFRMDTLLRLVETIPKSSYPLKNPERYGLQTPKLEVQFNKDKSNAVSIKFGDSEPIKMRRYLSVGNKLYLTNDTFLYALNSVATDYINHKLLPDDFKIKQLDLPNLKLSIKDEKWQAAPRQENFSVDSVNELLIEWQNAQATDIKSFTKKLNFSNKDRIKIYAEDASTLTFYILKDKNAFVLVNKLLGLQYNLPKEKQSLLLSLPEFDIDKEVPNKVAPDA